MIDSIHTGMKQGLNHNKTSVLYNTCNCMFIGQNRDRKHTEKGTLQCRRFFGDFATSRDFVWKHLARVDFLGQVQVNVVF